jgi:thiol-disulfide isomerase/thioredoxin
MNAPGDDDRATPPVRRTSATLNLFVLTLVFAVTFLLIRTSLKHSSGGGQASYAWKVRSLEGRPVDLARYKGRAIFLNLWATWCPPCREEMPSIARLAANPRLKDVAFLCVSNEDSTAVMNYLSSHRSPMTMLVTSEPPPPVYETDGIPATFLIAPDGRIVRREVGGMDWDTPENVRLLEGLASESR